MKVDFWCLVCQMPNIWHLAYQTPKTEYQEMCYMCQNFKTCYSTFLNMRVYRRECHNFLYLFYLLFLSPPNTSHSLSLVFVFFIPLPQHADLNKDHHLTPPIFVPRQNSTPRTRLRTQPGSGFEDKDDDSSAEIRGPQTESNRRVSWERQRVASERMDWSEERLWGLRDGEDEQMPEIKAIGDRKENGVV